MGSHTGSSATASSDNPQISSRSPEVPKERPYIVLALLLGAWLHRPEIRCEFEAAVREVADGADPAYRAEAVGYRPTAVMVGRVLRLVEAQLIAGRADAMIAARYLREWRKLAAAERDACIEDLLRQHADRDPDDLDRWAFELAVGRARTAAYSWSADGPRGNRASLTSPASLTPLSEGAIALGHRFAGCCLECGKPVLQDRTVAVTHPSGNRETIQRRVRSDYHDECEPSPVVVKRRDKAIERLVALLAAALPQ